MSDFRFGVSGSTTQAAEIRHPKSGIQLFHPIPMRFRLRNNEEMQIGQFLIGNAVRHTRWDVEAFRRIYGNALAVHLESGGAEQDIEKLLSMLVEVGFFGSAGRHRFLYHAEAVRFEEVPALAAVAPLIVFGVVECPFQVCS